MTETIVFAEGSESGPTALSLELVSKASEIGHADVFYSSPKSESNSAITTLGSHGARRIYLMNPGDALVSGPAVIAMAAIVEEVSYDLVLLGQSYNGRDVAGGLSARLGKSVLSNAVDLAVDEDGIKATHEVFGGSMLVQATIASDPPFLVVARPKSFEPRDTGSETPEVVHLDAPETGSSNAKIVASHVEEREGPQLDDAAVIVSGGRGLGSGDSYAMVDSLGKLLGAATGATRAIVDAGWVPYAKQVGQAGKTVKPDIYMAIGISGAMQHMVGMKDSKIIIAVNKDRDAPIFAIADLGIVGDLHNVIPKLIESLETRA